MLPSELVIKLFEPVELEPLKPNAIEVLREGLYHMTGTYWISSGTLLGLYRDHQLIPHDTDLDVNVLDHLEITEKDLPGFRLMRTQHYKGKVMQTAFIKDDVIFDNYYFYSEGEYAVNYNDQGIIKKPLKFLKTTIYKGYPVPTPIEEFLEWRFGDWKTPKVTKDTWDVDHAHINSW